MLTMDTHKTCEDLPPVAGQDQQCGARAARTLSDQSPVELPVSVFELTGTISAWAFTEYMLSGNPVDGPEVLP
jgi:hypothetical protein